MSDRSVSFLRAVAAITLCVSGIGLIASLWLRELTEVALADALLGAIYLVLGIGLFGQSRFSLCMAIVIPAAAIFMHLYYNDHAEPLPTLRIVFDSVVIFFCSIVLWQVRHRPSV
jgi:hypothetical protein